MELFVSYTEQWINKQFFQPLIFFDPDTDRQGMQSLRRGNSGNDRQSKSDQGL